MTDPVSYNDLAGGSYFYKNGDNYVKITTNAGTKTYQPYQAGDPAADKESWSYSDIKALTDAGNKVYYKNGQNYREVTPGVTQIPNYGEAADSSWTYSSLSGDTAYYYKHTDGKYYPVTAVKGTKTVYTAVDGKTEWSYNDVKNADTTYYYKYNGSYYEVTAGTSNWGATNYYDLRFYANRDRYLTSDGSTTTTQNNARNKNNTATLYTGTLYTGAPADCYYASYTVPGQYRSTTYYLSDTGTTTTQPTDAVAVDTELFAGTLYVQTGATSQYYAQYTGSKGTTYYLTNSSPVTAQPIDVTDVDALLYTGKLYKEIIPYSASVTIDHETKYLAADGTLVAEKPELTDADTPFWTCDKLYQQESKLEMMQRAVNDFIDAVAGDPAAVNFEQGTAHKISIVKFASDKSDNIGNDLTRDKYNCSQIVTALTPVTGAQADVQTLKTAVAGLTAAGATRVDYGMERAVAALDGSGDGHKAIIVVTDGVPTTQSTFSNTVANDAIGYAAQLKANGNTSVFMIGMLDSVTTQMNNFMNAVSSNYPNAKKANSANNWQSSMGSKLTQDVIYCENNPANLTLDGLFYRVRKFIATTATPADTEAVLHDQISEYFDYVDDSLAAYAVPCDAKTGKWEELTDANKAEYLLTSGINAVMRDRALTVDGYSFNKDHLHYQIPAMGSGQSAGDYIGEQLVVTYQIKRNTTPLEGSKKVSVGGPTMIDKVLEQGEDPEKLIGIDAGVLLATVGDLEVTYVLNGGTIPARGSLQEPDEFQNPKLVPYGSRATYVGAVGLMGGWTITKQDKVFAGWYTDTELTKSWNFKDPVTTDLTLYAKWVDADYDVTVKVTSDGTTPANAKRVELRNGENVFASNATPTTTGSYVFNDVPAGDYDVVATADNGLTATIKITVSATGEFTLTLPSDISTEVKKVDPDARDVSADLSDLAEQYQPASGDTAKIVMNIESVEDAERTTDRTKAEHAITAIKSVAQANNIPTENLEYMDVDLKHYVNDAFSANITNTANFVPFTVQFPTDGRNIFVFRWHDGDNNNTHDNSIGSIQLTKNSASGEDYYEVGNNSITIYSKNFSVYGIGWTDEVAPVYYDDSHQVHAPAMTSNGKLTISQKWASSGATVKLTVVPDEGHSLTELTVTKKNGDSVELKAQGKGVYTFKMPAADVWVNVSFDCPRDETCPIEPYFDTKNDAWWHDGIHYCLENELMNGFPNGTFQPNGNTTRAQVTVMIWRLAGSPVANYAHPFTDVKDDYWYTEAIRWAAAEKVVKGISETEFAPEAPVTREQLAVMLYRYAQYKGQGFTGDWTFLLDFSDREKVSSWAYEAVCWCNMKSVVTGRTETEFVPSDNATRAEVAAMFQRFCVNALA